MLVKALVTNLRTTGGLGDYSPPPPHVGGSTVDAIPPCLSKHLIFIIVNNDNQKKIHFSSIPRNIYKMPPTPVPGLVLSTLHPPPPNTNDIH